MKNLKIAFVYDKVNTWGGAERVLLAIHEIFLKHLCTLRFLRRKKQNGQKFSPK